MKPLLTHPAVENAPNEAAPFEAAPRPRTAPVGARALQGLLVVATTALVAIWLWTWHGVQAYAWPGIDNGLAERGLSYLLILAPAVPVNLLAAIWLGRGGRRAQLYLAAAGALALVQATLLLTPAAMPGESMSAGSTAVGVRYIATMGPLLFAAASIASSDRVRTWLGADPARARPRLVGIETAVWCLALALALGTGTEMRQWAQAAAKPEAAQAEYTEDGTWARLEQAVTDTTDAFPAFSGFAARTLEVAPCGYRTPAGLPTYRYQLTYELRTADPGTYEDQIATRWNEGDYRITYDGATFDGAHRITAERAYPTEDGAHTVTLGYTGGEAAALHLASPCVERTGVPECQPSQGDPTTDQIFGITCPKQD
ncbi:MAG TPA: hypothetical protein VHG10_01130 [Glycomyces sp.]|nr:hypothetical protein [Glycomyces sp.]